MKNPDSNTLKVRSNNPIILTIILIILFIISVSYMVFYNIGLFKNNKNITELPETVNKVNQETAANLQLIKLDANYTQPALTNFREPQPSNTLSRSPNLQQISNIEQPDNVSNHSDSFLNNYRNYLLNINLLTINFLQDKTYTEQIQKIEFKDFPQEIKNTIMDLINYNKNYLLHPKTEKIFPATSTGISSWIEKFFKIEKKPHHKDQDNLRQKIIKNLDSFLLFFYSSKFQQKFVEEPND